MRTKNEPITTRTAKLANSVGDITLHVYSHSQLATLPQTGARPITGMAHMYRCTKTGDVRRWGFDVTYAKDDGAN